MSAQKLKRNFISKTNSKLAKSYCCYALSGLFYLSDAQAVALLSESELLTNYDGVIGTAPKHETLSSAGVSFEEAQNGAQAYGFFSQTLPNQIYYEVRAYGRYNYMAQNPLFNDVPPSNVNNPLGYGFAGKVGYNFHPNDQLDLVPYLRFSYLRNMTLVYEDLNGNYINSTTLAGFIGNKFAFKVAKTFTPYFDFSLGYQQIALTGAFSATSGSPLVNTSSTVDQLVSIAEVGLTFKVSERVSIIPYWQYITSANYPDSVAQAPYSSGGFNISTLTNTQQAIGLKFATAW